MRLRKVDTYLVEALVILALICLCAALCCAQSFPNPYEKAVLDFYYRLNTNQIDGADIIVGSLPHEALAFVVVTNELDPVFVIFRDGTWTNHITDASAHHVRFETTDETDQVHVAWVASDWDPHTNNQSAHHESYTNLNGITGCETQIFFVFPANWSTNITCWESGVATQRLTNTVSPF